MYYRSVDDLPIKILFKVFETDNLKFLIKHHADNDKVREKDLRKAWGDIVIGYKALDPAKRIESIVRLMQQIDAVIAKHEMISLAIFILRLGWSEDMAEILNKNKYIVDENNLEETLDAAEENAKALKTKVGVKEAEFKLLIGDEEDVSVDINKILARMSAELKIPFKFNEVTVVEFFAYRAELESRAKSSKKEDSYGKRRR